MGAFGPIHWLILAVVVLLVFGGKGKITGLMGDTAKGIKAFRDGLKSEDEAPKPAATPAQPLPTEAPKEEVKS